MRTRYGWIVGLLVAVAVVFVLAPAASADPDGLDRVSEDEGFADAGEAPAYEWLPDYSIPGVDDEYWSTVLAGTVGVAIVFVAMWAMGFVIARRRPTEHSTAPRGPEGGSDPEARSVSPSR